MNLELAFYKFWGLHCRSGHYWCRRLLARRSLGGLGKENVWNVTIVYPSLRTFA
jgi:hypothetical protein